MIKIERTAVMNIDNAIRGARNPMNSWAKSDSGYGEDGKFYLGDADRAFAARLCAAGSTHRKFIRQIFVSVDITAPLYWWKEFDTYKVGTVANSTSTMHKLHSKPFSRDDFSHDQMTPDTLETLDLLINHLEQLRLKFIETNEKSYWYNMIQLLPSSYEQMRTCTLNYENLVGMYALRRNHKLDEWRKLCEWIEKLPYAEEMITGSPLEG